MPLRQLLFSNRSEADASRAISTLEASFPEEFTSFSHMRSDGGLWIVTAILAENFGAQIGDATPAKFAGLLGDMAIDLRVEDIPEKDWVTHTLENLAPVRAGSVVVHGSHDRPVSNYGHVGVCIDAGLAFGTGHHETTQGCLILLSQILKRRHFNNACDIGSGSGVLAIAFAKMTHHDILATDIDPVAVDVARENAKKNAVRNEIQFVVANGTHHPLISTMAPYDLVFANILARPLRQMARNIGTITSRQSSLILSGLLVEQEAGVLSAYRQCGFCLERRHVLGDWSSLHLVKT